MACDSVAGRVQLGPADVGGAVNDLPLQVAEIDHVEIDEADAADAGRGEVEAERRAEAAGADEQHAAMALSRFCPSSADLRHDEVPAVAGDFLLRQIHALGAGAEVVERHVNSFASIDIRRLTGLVGRIFNPAGLKNRPTKDRGVRWRWSVYYGFANGSLPAPRGFAFP